MLRERANQGLHDYIFQWLSRQNWFGQIDSVLDIGCGTGAWLSRFNPSMRLMGVDLDTQQFGLPQVPVQSLNLDEARNKRFEPFKLICSLELIEHLENPGSLFSFVKNNLHSNGYWLISTPNIHSIEARLKYLLNGHLPHFDEKSDPTHVYPVFLKNLDKLIERHGFEKINTAHFPEKGLNNFSVPIRFAANILRPFVPKIAGGDNLILVLKHRKEQ